MHEVIKRIPLFSGLEEGMVNKISEFCRLRIFNKGDIIFFESEPYRGFYAVVSGLVKVYKISRDGREHIIHIIAPFNTFAEVPLLENLDKITDDDFRYPACSMAIEDNTKVVLVPANEFRDILKNDLNISLRMLSGLAKRLRHLNHHIEELTLKDVTKRTAAFLISVYENTSSNSKLKGSTISLSVNRSDMAAYLGTAIETLSRTLSRLQAEGIIEVTGKKIFIKNAYKLKEISLS
ncbi:MAG: Crp/Fnr family transcriptional regulator [Ignavibacteria bacterium]|nr:Crp/Fnr family transcriptional regulator [Ignavibacteria bacterium]